MIRVFPATPPKKWYIATENPWLEDEFPLWDLGWSLFRGEPLVFGGVIMDLFKFMFYFLGFLKKR